MSKQLSFSEILKKYPSPLNGDQLRNNISDMLIHHQIKIIVLDDDPTGIQTVNHCLLLTNWKKENLNLAFRDPASIFYILTNSRSLRTSRVNDIIQEIIAGVLDLNRTYQYRLIFISRSDSTLRGHFPLEPDRLNLALSEQGFPVKLPVFFIPAFLEQGRYTLHGIHYLKEADQLIPVGETEFSADNVFPYSHSELKKYIREKSENKIDEKEIDSFFIDELRGNSVSSIAGKIRRLSQMKYITVDALDYADLQKFALSVLSLLVQNETSVVFRTSSSFPKAIGAVNDQALLTKKDLILKHGTGLFIVGSHVKKTTQQLSKILKNDLVEGIEVDIRNIGTDPQKTRDQVVAALIAAVKNGKTPVVYTSRKEFRSDDRDLRLSLGRQISLFLADMVRNLPFIPTYLVAKGGITSHDILTDGLGVEHAIVKGQILPGVPVIITGETNEYVNLPYIIFPGNVGDDDSLVTVFEKLK